MKKARAFAAIRDALVFSSSPMSRVHAVSSSP